MNYMPWARGWLYTSPRALWDVSCSASGSRAANVRRPASTASAGSAGAASDRLDAAVRPFDSIIGPGAGQVRTARVAGLGRLRLGRHRRGAGSSLGPPSHLSQVHWQPSHPPGLHHYLDSCLLAGQNLRD
jgi:hypothetical protein